MIYNSTLIILSVKFIISESVSDVSVEIKYSSDILLKAGAIKICVDDILIATKPTKEQDKWLYKNPVKRYHIDSKLFKSYISKETEKAIKALPYHFSRHSL